jgi:hypothetical protein
MADQELQQTTILLTEKQQEQLDKLAHSRTEAIRRLLRESDIEFPAEQADDPEEVCPECGRKPALVIAGSALVKSADEDKIEYCRVDKAASWFYIHSKK